MKAKLLVLASLLFAPMLLGQQPQYGGIISNKPVRMTDVLGIEETWLGTRTASISILVRYRISCDNGNGQITPTSGSFIATASFTAAVTFAGTGQFFPCNGWLNWASMLVYTPNTITPGELMAQLEIHNAMPIGWNVAAPAANGATTTTISQAILTGTIEDVLCSGSIVSGYVTSWPSCVQYGTNPVQFDTGTVQNINVAQPASATNWTCGSGVTNCQVIANNNQVQVINVTYTLTTSSTAGNRYACVEFLTGGTAGTVVGGPYCSPYAQVASTAVTYNFSAGVGWATNCSQIGATQTATKCPVIQVPLPLYWEANGGLDGLAINAVVLNDAATPASGLQTGDQESAANIRVRLKHAND